MKRLLGGMAAAVVALVVWAGPGLGQDAVSDHLGMIAVGYRYDKAPLTVSYIASPGLGLRIGGGFKTESEVALDPVNWPGLDERMTAVALSMGVFFPLHSNTWSFWSFDIGAGFSAEDEATGVGDPDRRPKVEKRTQFHADGTIAFNLFLGKLGFPDLAVAGGVGVSLGLDTPPGDADTKVTFQTITYEVNAVGAGGLGVFAYFD